VRECLKGERTVYDGVVSPSDGGVTKLSAAAKLSGDPEEKRDLAEEKRR